MKVAYSIEDLSWPPERNWLKSSTHCMVNHFSLVPNLSVYQKRQGPPSRLMRPFLAPFSLPRTWLNPNDELIANIPRTILTSVMVANPDVDTHASNLKDCHSVKSMPFIFFFYFPPLTQSSSCHLTCSRTQHTDEVRPPVLIGFVTLSL
jgi:hypothetical protein